MYWLCLIKAIGCPSSVQTCFTASIDGDVVVIWTVDSRSLKQQGEMFRREV